MTREISPWRMIVFVLMGFTLREGIASPSPAGIPGLSVWEKPQVLTGMWKIRQGDSAAWALAGYPDAEWDSVPLKTGLFREIVRGGGYAWYRREIILPAKPETGKLLALLHPPTTPQEFYWDGELIGRTGRLGASKAEERNGVLSLTAIPDRLSGPGRHLLAIRMTAHQPLFYPNSVKLTLGEFTALHLGHTREMMVLFFLAGVFVFAAIYRFLNYRASGYGRNTVLFSVCVLAAAGYIVTKNLGFVTNLDAGQQLALRLALSVSWYFMISMVPDYFIFAESFPHRWLLPVLLIGGLFVAVPMGFVYTGYSPIPWMKPIYSANQIFVYISMSASLWVIGWALWRKQTGSGLALLGILSVMAGISVTWKFQIEWAWAAGIAAHVILLARVQSQQMSERMRRHQEMDLHSARLEIELLKKNIQPHFLLNSLNSIIAWLEEEPRTAARLVNALADELGMLLRISSLKTISLAEEIRLCRTHLQVMGLRQDKTYSLEHTGVRGDERIPPMVLHTLVENGLTHGYVGKSTGTFLLRRVDLPGSVRYSLFNDGVPREKKEKKAEGTGLRYVRTRLEETFPGRWNLESRSVENGWEVTLDIRRDDK